MVNKIILIGNAGNAPDIKRFDGGTTMARVSIATSENRQGPGGDWETHTEWHSVIMWRELAERAEKMIYKGAQVFVEGKISYREYDKDGQKTKITEIVAATFRVLSKKQEADPAPTKPADYDPLFPTTSEAKPASNAAQIAVPTGLEDDGLPF